MRKMMLFSLAIATTVLISCNNSGKKHNHGHSGHSGGNVVDSLKEAIDEHHNTGMAKMYELTKLQQDTKRAIDSIGKLSTTSDALGSYKASLDSVLKDLEYAEFAMDKWMPEYYSNTDTLSDNETERIKYLQNELSKASRITDAIVNGIAKAGSLLKTKP